MAAGISVHVVDVTRAAPAAGLRVEVFALESGRAPVAQGALDANGALGPAALGGRLARGIYEVVFHIGDYYRGAGIDLPEPAFLEEVPFRFGLADPAQHYHLPMKMSPWGFSLFRGG